MGRTLQPFNRSYCVAAASCLHTLPWSGSAPWQVLPNSSPASLHSTNMLLGIHSLAVTFRPSETFWQLETLNANFMPFSLLFMNRSNMGHFLSLPIPLQLEQKGGSLSLNWLSLPHTQLYHLVCFTHCPLIWQQSWVQANLHLQHNGFCVFCYSGIYYMQLKQKFSKPLPPIIL